MTLPAGGVESRHLGRGAPFRTAHGTRCLHCVDVGPAPMLPVHGLPLAASRRMLQQAAGVLPVLPAAGVVIPILAEQFAALRMQRGQIAGQVEALLEAHPLQHALRSGTRDSNALCSSPPSHP